MKYSIACFALVAYSANAFSVQPQQQARKGVSLCATSDKTSNPAGWIAATAFAGWTLVTAPMAASAVVPPVENILPGKKIFFARHFLRGANLSLLLVGKADK